MAAAKEISANAAIAAVLSKTQLGVAASHRADMHG